MLSASVLEQLIDNIPSYLIAQFDVRMAFNFAPSFAKPLIQLSLPRDHPQAIKNWEERIPEIREALKEKRKIPRPYCTGGLAELIGDKMAAPLEAKEKTLFVRDNELNELAKELGTGCYANVFLVDKSSYVESLEDYIKRIIIDSRFANCVLMSKAQMELFSLEVLRERVAYCFSKSPNVATLNCDLRHWFHQIPLPRSIQKYLKIVLAGGKVVFPRIWPMGLHDSPGVAQAMTWAIVLRGLEGGSKEGWSELGLEWTGKTTFDEYLRWLPLSNGGGVFVLIDGIFVIHPNKKIVENWRKRIAKSCETLHAVLKDERSEEQKQQDANDPAVVKATTEFKLNHLHAIQIVELKKGRDDTSVKFAGTRISGAGMKVDKQMPTLEELHLAGQSWNGTYRQLASIMGLMLWFHRVHNRRMLEIAEFMSVYEAAYPGPNKKDWDKKATLTQQQFQALRNSYELCQKNGYTPFGAPFIVNKKVFAATDASSRGLGWVFQLENEKNRKVSGFIPHSFGKENIHLAELVAVNKMIADVDKYCDDSNQERPNLFVVAIDSQVVLGMLRRRYSKIKRFQDVLWELFGRLGNRRLVVTYIQSKPNPADEPSRDLDFNDEKWQKAKVALDARVEEALKYFMVTGKEVHKSKQGIREEDGVVS